MLMRIYNRESYWRVQRFEIGKIAAADGLINRRLSPMKYCLEKAIR